MNSEMTQNEQYFIANDIASSQVEQVLLGDTSQSIENKEDNDYAKDCHNDLQKISIDIGQNENIKDANLLEKEQLDDKISVIENQKIDNEQQPTQVENESQQDKVFMRADWQDKVSKFMQDYPVAKDFVSLVSEEIIRDESLHNNPNCLEIAYAKVMSKSYTPPCDIINSQDFREQYVFNNQDIKNRIIEEYLLNLDKTKPPKSLISRGQIILSPPDRPRSIEEAGAIMTNMLHNRRI